MASKLAAVQHPPVREGETPLLWDPADVDRAKVCRLTLEPSKSVGLHWGHTDFDRAKVCRPVLRNRR